MFLLLLFLTTSQGGIKTFCVKFLETTWFDHDKLSWFNILIEEVIIWAIKMNVCFCIDVQGEWYSTLTSWKCINLNKHVMVLKKNWRAFKWKCSQKRLIFVLINQIWRFNILSYVFQFSMLVGQSTTLLRAHKICQYLNC